MRCVLLFALLPVCCGCGTSAPAAPGTVAIAKKAETAKAPEPQPPTFAPKADPNAKIPEVPVPPPVEMVRVPARAGASRKGDYDQLIFTTPLTAYFSIKEQIIFDANIPKAMEIFEGLRNRKPISHQEFMTEIIAKSNIRLPQLPPQHRYIYDPERGELMIERPKTAD